MKEKVTALLNPKLSDLDIIIGDVIYGYTNKELILNIVLDSPKKLTLDDVVKATKIINPILDREDIIKEQYTLDVYCKSKEGVEE